MQLLYHSLSKKSSKSWAFLLFYGIIKAVMKVIVKDRKKSLIISLIASIDSGMAVFLTATMGILTAIISRKRNRKCEKALPHTETAVTSLLFLTAAITAESIGNPRSTCVKARTDESYRERFI